MLAIPEIICENSWNPDSGATNHVTSEGSNLMVKSELYGPDQVYKGDGKDLTIAHIGHSMFSSPALPLINYFMSQR